MTWKRWGQPLIGGLMVVLFPLVTFTVLTTPTPVRTAPVQAPTGPLGAPSTAPAPTAPSQSPEPLKEAYTAPTATPETTAPAPRTPSPTPTTTPTVTSAPQPSPTPSEEPSSESSPTPVAERQWVTLTEAAMAGVPGVNGDTTVRNLLTVTSPAMRIKIRFSNEYGTTALHLQEVRVGRTVSPGKPALESGTDRQVTFAGDNQTDVPAGESIWSDPIDLSVTALAELAVSIYAPNSPINEHYTGDPATQYAPGSFTASGNKTNALLAGPFSSFNAGTVWWADAVAGYSVTQGTIVTLGDSITAGTKASGGGARWSDILAQRLMGLSGDRRLSVANAGISGNTVTTGPNPYDATGECCGAPANQRLAHDALNLPGVSTVFLWEGTNDIGGGENAASVSATAIKEAMTKIANRTHDAGKSIVVATILPMCNAPDSVQETTRLEVNQWIRTSPLFDGVVDFDEVLRDPTQPNNIKPEWRTDCYHPNAAGNRVLGNAIPLELVAP